MEIIGSIKDERIVLARALTSRRGRDEYSRMLLHGEQILDWAIQAGIEIEFILIASSAPTDLIERFIPAAPLYQVSDGIQKKVTATNYVVPIVGISRQPADPGLAHPDFLIVLDDLKDLGNIGTIIRTCNAFSIHRIVSTNRETDIYSRRTVEASRGTVFSTRTERYPSAEHAIKRLREGGYQIIATSPRGNKLQSLLELQAKPVALVLGNESTGVNKVFEREADYLIQIPMSSAIESLNVGVAAGISVYELRLKQVMSMIVKNIRSTLGRELNVTGMLVQKALDAELRKVSDLSSQQVVFMMVLRCDLEMSVKDMCQQFGILESRTEEFLEPLKERGLVLYDESLRLTPKGEDLLAKLWFTVENAESKILSGFSQNEIETLKKQMSRIQANCVQLMD